MATKSTKSPSKRKTRPTSAGLPVKNILVPLDFSELGNAALVYAVELAAQLGAKITLAHVIERPYYYYAEVGMSYPGAESFENLAGVAEQTVERVCKEHQLELPTLGKTIVEAGTPYQTIVDIAKARKVDLIILSTHGHTGLAQVFIGSTAERVVRHAACPVLVVRPQKPAK